VICGKTELKTKKSKATCPFSFLAFTHGNRTPFLMNETFKNKISRAYFSQVVVPRPELRYALAEPQKTKRSHYTSNHTERVLAVFKPPKGSPVAPRQQSLLVLPNVLVEESLGAWG